MRFSSVSALLVASVLLLTPLTFHCATNTSGADTGAVCPSGSSLTYASFGQSFMDTYCTSCHSGNERPDLSSADAVKRELHGVLNTAAAGPKATNNAMPTDGDIPADERVKLGEWLACGAP